MNVTALAECVQVNCGYNILAQKSEIGRLSWRPLLFQAESAMAAIGTKRTSQPRPRMSAIGIRADTAIGGCHVRLCDVRLWHLASIRARALSGRYRRHSGHWPELALNASVANDPKRTSAVHCGNGFDASFRPYQSTRLSRYNSVFLSLGADMQRREFITLLGGAAAAWPTWARGQIAKNIPTIGVLWHAGNEKEEGAYFTTLQQGLRDNGYIDGQTIRLENRFAGEQYDRFNKYAAELVALKVDVLVAITQPAAIAAQAATKEIPIVFVLAPDPLGSKLVTSLAKPTGNITGLSNMAVDVTAKRLEILKEAIPALTRVALLINPSDPSLAPRIIDAVQSAAVTLNLSVQIYEAREPEDIDRAFAMIAKDGIRGVITGYDTMFTNEKKRLAESALAHGLPVITQSRSGSTAGAFMSYGVDSLLMFRRAGAYIHRILKGEKPSELPVEQPTKFELIINLKTAKALGIDVPPTLITRADEVIE
jgi:putative ABC transport system substrate-binding protein